MTSLSKTGVRRLAEAEAKIERGLSTFWEVGSALMQIRDERLYRADFATFEDYCQDRWQMTRRRANQLVEAAQMGTMVPIENERQARALAPVKEDPTEVREIYAEAERRGDTSSAGIGRVMAERHPTPPLGVDPETGEIAAGEDVPSATGSGAGEDVAPGRTREAPSPSPAALTEPPTVGGTEGYRAAATKARSTVRSHLLTLDPERVILTSDEPDHWRQFSDDVRGWLDELDAHLSGPALKAVQ